MRQVGSIQDERQARLFADYLVSEGIVAHAEQDNGDWAIWVRDENQVSTAAEALTEFVKNPADDRYLDASQRAEQRRQATLQRRQHARRHTIEMRAQWNRGMARRAPLIFSLIGVSVLVAILTNAGDKIAPVMNRLTFCHLEPTQQGIQFSTDYFLQIKQGQVWRLVTPIFIHFSLIHLAFNMYMLYYLGSQIENRMGTIWLGILVLVIAATSNAAQAYLSQAFHNDIVGRSPLFGGMSGVDYGLFGYIWMKTLYAPQAGLYVSRGTIIILLAWLVICLSPSMSVANGAHGAGLAVGVALGYIPELQRGAGRH